jgi:hypothetical protein
VRRESTIIRRLGARSNLTQRWLVQRFLKFLGGAEDYFLAGLDLHGLTPCGIAAGSLSPPFHFQRAEAAHPDSCSGLQVCDYRGHEVCQQIVDLLLRQGLRFPCASPSCSKTALNVTTGTAKAFGLGAARAGSFAIAFFAGAAFLLDAGRVAIRYDSLSVKGPREIMIVGQSGTTAEQSDTAVEGRVDHHIRPVGAASVTPTARSTGT